jgi:hypothetical protein
MIPVFKKDYKEKNQAFFGGGFPLCGDPLVYVFVPLGFRPLLKPYTTSC